MNHLVQSGISYKVLLPLMDAHSLVLHNNSEIQQSFEIISVDPGGTEVQKETVTIASHGSLEYFLPVKAGTINFKGCEGLTCQLYSRNDNPFYGLSSVVRPVLHE